MLFRVIGLTLALGEELNPITRVVSLLEGLSKKIEAAGKAEEKLYDDFVCWCKTIKSQKTLSNTAAAQRISDLNAYINDIKEGRIEFTTEEEDLRKEIEQLKKQLQMEEATRDQAYKDFLQTEEEIHSALTALDKAITVLGKATEDSKKGVLLNVRFALRKAFWAKKNRNMEYVEAMIDKALDDPQAPPTNKEWNKMDAEKATFSKDYKGRSFKIQGVLKDMKKTFQENLEQAEKAEDLAYEDYERLRKGKQKTLKNRERSLSTLHEETAARENVLETSEKERDDLNDQLTNDQQILADTTKTCDDKKTEFQERSTLRTEEVASISKAISILRSDDARDTFKRSFDSQTPDFLQMTRRDVSKGCAKARDKKAIHILRHVGSHRLRALSLVVASKAGTSEFSGVIEKIDAILGDLEAEGADDEESKNQCEKIRAEKTEEAKEYSNAIDSNTEEIARQIELIQKFDVSIKEKKESVAAIKKSLAEAEEQRAKESAEFQESDADDKEAVGLIEKAILALQEFYEAKESGGNLIQVQSQKAKVTPPELEAGKAPPPPPGTWEMDYGGEKESSQGVVAILILIKADVEKDMKVAEKEEEEAKSLYEDFLTESLGQLDKLVTLMDEAMTSRGEAETKKRTEEKDQTQQKDVLGTTIDTIEAEEPRCNFITVNFDVRKKNREAEIDGLNKAKAVLNGASFGFLEC